MILSLFSQKPDHPLADAREVRHIIAQLPLDNTYKAVDEIVGWLESLQYAEGFRLDRYFDTVCALDEAAQPHLRRLARDYLHTARLSKSEEKRLWTVSVAFWERLARLYESCLKQYEQKEKGADNLKEHLPLLLARLMGALGAKLKWQKYRYGPPRGDLWQRLGRAYLAAEREKIAARAVELYPGQLDHTSAEAEYVKVLVFHASSLDSLLPLEIELAERLIAHFQPLFVFGSTSRPDSVYWVDPAQPAGPLRLVREPAPTLTLHFFSPGEAPQALAELIRQVARGDVPAGLNLGGQYSSRMLLPLLRHLSLYWASTPPQREHPRHRVKSRLTVVNGFDGAVRAFAGSVEKAEMEGGAESWIVDNVSLGGFGASVPLAVPNFRGDWLRIGALLAMQPEGGDNWLLGIVRRHGKESDSLASVGIQTLARQAQSVELRPLSSSAYAAAATIPGVLLQDGGEVQELRAVLPPATFDLRESLEYVADSQRFLLVPVEFLERGADYEIARFRKHVAEN